MGIQQTFSNFLTDEKGFSLQLLQIHVLLLLFGIPLHFRQSK